LDSRPSAPPSTASATFATLPGWIFPARSCSCSVVTPRLVRAAAASARSWANWLSYCGIRSISRDTETTTAPPRPSNTRYTVATSASAAAHAGAPCRRSHAPRGLAVTVNIKARKTGARMCDTSRKPATATTAPARPSSTMTPRGRASVPLPPSRLTGAAPSGRPRSRTGALRYCTSLRVTAGPFVGSASPAGVGQSTLTSRPCTASA
jgi:hypothetical protein